MKEGLLLIGLADGFQGNLLPNILVVGGGTEKSPETKANFHAKQLNTLPSHRT